MAIYVNKEFISEEQIRFETERLKYAYEKEFQSEGENDSEMLSEWAKENLIEKHLLQQEANKTISNISKKSLNAALDKYISDLGGKEIYSEKLKELNISHNEFVKQFEIQMKVELLLEQINLKTPQATEEEALLDYNCNKDKFMTPEIFRAAHILIAPNANRTKDAAFKEIKLVEEKIKDGIDFVELAQLYSDCPDNEGDLGYFTRGEMVAEFENQIALLAEGETSSVFETRYGFHIAKLLNKKRATPLEFIYVKDKISIKLTEDKKVKAVEDFIDSLKAQALIE